MSYNKILLNPSVTPSDANSASVSKTPSIGPMYTAPSSPTMTNDMMMTPEIVGETISPLKKSLVANERQVYLTWQNVFFSVPLKKADLKTMIR